MSEFPRGVALAGAVWPGGSAPVLPDGLVVVDADGRVAYVGPAASFPLPEGLALLGGPGHWVGPGVVDAHVHLAFGAPAALLAGGVVGARDLGAPLSDALAWQGSTAPVVRVAGPLLTAPDGYPSRSWGAGGFALFVSSPDGARAAVRSLVADGVDFVKLALEPAGGAPVPTLDVCAAVVRTAHEAGLPVAAHALTVPMVRQALDAGVDELCHTPVEPLPASLVERIASAGVRVVSTLATFVHDDPATAAVANAAALVAAGVPLVYGTDLGNAGTSPGVSPDELALLADGAGLGAWGALRSATSASAALVGLPGRVALGERAALALLPADPLRDPGRWRTPVAVVAG